MIQSNSHSHQSNCHVYGLHRDGRIIIEQDDTSQRFMMRAKDIIVNSHLAENFPKQQIQWLEQVAAVDATL